MWPTDTPPVCDKAAWTSLMDLRAATFQGFAAREAEKGLVSLPVGLNTARGQDIVRLYAFRALEEYVEAVEASDPDHLLEELIDSTNYWLSLYLLEGKGWPIERAWPVSWGHQRPNVTDLGLLTAKISKVMDLFRNRSWMNNAQDVYFGGYGELTQAIEYALNLISRSFPSWEVFWQFYVAKDNVLQFRLRTNY